MKRLMKFDCGKATTYILYQHQTTRGLETPLHTYQDSVSIKYGLLQKIYLEKENETSKPQPDKPTEF